MAFRESISHILIQTLPQDTPKCLSGSAGMPERTDICGGSHQWSQQASTETPRGFLGLVRDSTFPKPGDKGSQARPLPGMGGLSVGRQGAASLPPKPGCLSSLLGPLGAGSPQASLHLWPGLPSLSRPPCLLLLSRYDSPYPSTDAESLLWGCWHVCPASDV